MKKDKVILTRVDEFIAERVEYIASNSKDIELTKSEVVRIILHAFFKLQKDKDFEKVRELAIKMRKGLLYMVSGQMQGVFNVLHRNNRLNWKWWGG